MTGMDHSALIDRLGGTAAVARRVGAQPASVSEWRKKRIPDSRLIQLGAEIERLGIMRRWHLRPDDWHRIWPELIGAEGAPPVPAEQQEVRDAA
jgi:DNA-binding transcriptional regulator YdaS (Cro superfamily)